jgi:hypothetical protein
MEALLLNILNEHHATETLKRIYREAWKAFTAYHMEGFTKEEEETKKRILQLMKGNRILQSHLEEDIWKAFTAYRSKLNIRLKKGEKSTGREGPSG